MQKLTIAIHVDALRYDYITADSMPFLHSLGMRGIRGDLIPPFGFEPDGAYFSGTSPAEYGGGAHFVFQGAGVPIPFKPWMPGLLDKLPLVAQYPIRKIAARTIRNRATSSRIRASPSIHWIPFRHLSYFEYASALFPYERGFLGKIPTLFDYCRAAHAAFFWHGYPEHDTHATAVRDRVKRALTSEARFAFLLIGDLDDVGHNAGPDSPERRRASRTVDECIAAIHAHALTIADVVDLCVFGDHGMVEVTRLLDIRRHLASTHLKEGKDYVAFVDSTMARFWFLRSTGEAELRACLGSIQGGRILDDADAQYYGLAHRDRRLGDCVFWADGGTLIYPSFWNVRNAKKGMHGYRHDVQDNTAAILFHSSAAKYGHSLKACRMADVFQTCMYSVLGQEIHDAGARGKALQLTGASG